jgi:dihydrofolate reductase
MSLDGFIAGPNGEYDWLAVDPAHDFAAFFKQFDTLVMGRRTYELARQGPGATLPGMKTVLCSRTLQVADDPDVTVTADAVTTVKALKSEPGKDIWLFGGADLFRCLLDSGVVDLVEVKIVPILLSQGIPLLPAGRRSPPLRLEESKPRPSGVVDLIYTVEYA